MNKSKKPFSGSIFDAYAQKMEDQGFIKKASDEDLKRDIYDLKTLGPDGKPYDMLDKAHPETIVVSKSYDAVNGIVENLKERSSIMNMIARKAPRIQMTNERYVKAVEDLIQETLKVSMLLDSKGYASLSKQALICTENLVKEADGTTSNIIAGTAGVAATALGFAVSSTVGLIVAPLALAGALLWISQHPMSAGFRSDLEKAISECDEAINGWASGQKGLSTVMNPVISKMKEILSDVDHFYSRVDIIKSDILEIKLETNPKAKEKALYNFNARYLKSGQDQDMKLLSKRIQDNTSALITALPDILIELKEAPKKYHENWGDETGLWGSIGRLWFTPTGTDVEDAITALQLVQDGFAELNGYMNSFLASMTEISSRMPSSFSKGTTSPTEDPKKIKKDPFSLDLSGDVQKSNKINKDKDRPDWL